MNYLTKGRRSLRTGKISLLFGFLMIYGLCHAQDINFGFRSGVGFSNFYAHQLPGEIPDSKFFTGDWNDGNLTLIDPNTPYLPVPYYKTSFVKDVRAGIFSYFYIDYELEPKFSAQIAVGYSQKGINMSFGLQNSTVNSDNSMVTLDYQFNRNLRLDYITVPLTVQYQLDEKKCFYILAGVYNSVAINFVIKESLESTKRQTQWPSGLPTTSAIEREMTVAYANRFDAGLLAGVGLNLPLSKRLDIGLDLRGSLGLLKVPKSFTNYGFLGFSRSTKNIGLETGLKLQYSLN